ncbi:MAG: extracellular solute-binding protein [Alphaproteobacteria bacterium]
MTGSGWRCIGVLLALWAAVAPSHAAEPVRGHGIAMHGDPKYPADFKHFDYANPNAPIGGTIKLGALDGYDSFNPFIIKGRDAAGASLIYDTLMENAADEPFSEYGLLAETVETPADRSWVRFTLRKESRWHDGKPVTADDLIWTFETLLTKGAPFYRAYYGSVDKVEKEGPLTVRFTFKPGDNRELPLILGQIPVLPKHWWAGRKFDEPLLEPPLGSGPYRIESFDTNRSVTYERVADYWGRDLPVRKGTNNFGLIQYEYYRDTTVLLEAFKAGQVDFRAENSSKDWATQYDFAAVQQGLVKKEELDNDRSAGMQGFAYNLRRPVFQDPKVRAALAYAFDFEWSNKTLFYGQYARTRSFFENSELAAEGLPQGEELAILERFRDRLPPEVFTTEYRPPETDGSGNIRPNLRIAQQMLNDAGWAVDPKTRVLTHSATGQPMRFEILLVQPLFERITLPFVRNLERLGVQASVRVVDSAQYQQRVATYDFDMVVTGWGQSLSPGNEQRDYWGSEAAAREGSRNLSGIASPVLDQLIELVIAAPTRESLVQRTRALDRVLQWSFIVIPNWYTPVDRVAYWDMFGHPAETPTQGMQFMAWWVDPELASRLHRRRAGGQ